MEPMVRCPHCGRYHPANAEYCPDKGLPIFKPQPVEKEKKPNLLWLLIVAVVLILTACILAAIFVVPRVLDNTKTSNEQPSIFVPTLTLPPLVTRISITETPAIIITNAPTVAEPSPTATFQPWQACSDSNYLSQLKIGMNAQVALEPPLPNRVRTNPNLNATILGYINPGEKMEILEGPSCDQGWVWWKVRAFNDNLEGWTAEGDQDSYWLVPLP